LIINYILKSFEQKNISELTKFGILYNNCDKMMTTSTFNNIGFFIKHVYLDNYVKIFQPFVGGDTSSNFILLTHEQLFNILQLINYIYKN
jgi:hypothetical protein